MQKTNKLNTMTRTMTREVQRIKQRKRENNENDAYLSCSSLDVSFLLVVIVVDVDLLVFMRAVVV